MYGTSTETSDRDYRGICIPPYEEYYHGFHKFEQYDPKGQDLTIFDLRKFVKLASECNPNIIELMFVPEENIIWCDDFGESLFAVREFFLSRKARHTFTGYAHSQLGRIKNHKRWIDSPPSKPDRQEMGLPTEAKVIGPDKIDAARSLGHTYFSEEMWNQIQLEVAYREAKKEWDAFHSWRTNRNPARYEMEQRFGYDGKHAMHLVRLLRMGFEIISTGQVIVKRPDAEELLEIRNGSWPFEQLLEYAATMEQKIADAEETSPLPWGIKFGYIESWLVNVLGMNVDHNDTPYFDDRALKIARSGTIKAAGVEIP